MTAHRRSVLSAALACVLALSAAAIPYAAPARAEPPRYEIEFLDRDSIEAPSEALPLGGTLVPGGLAISKNGRYVAGQIRDDQDGSQVAFRLDRASGAVEHVGALRAAFGTPFGTHILPQVNDSGHLVGRRFVDGQQQVDFWSEDRGLVSFGSARPAYSVRSLAYNRYFNNRDDVLVVPLPIDRGPTGASLWNPLLGTEAPLPFGSLAVNDQPAVVGELRTANDFDAFVWSAAQGLAVLPGPAGEHQTAFGINGHGQIVGESLPVDADGGFGRAYGVSWTAPDSDPIALPCPEAGGGDPGECAALHISESGGIFGGAAFDDGEPLVPMLWDGVDPFRLRDLLLDPNARCGYDQVSDTGELIGHCGIFDPDLPAGSPPVVGGPAILRPVHPGVLDCRGAVASPSALWPPNHELRPIEIAGVEAADGGEASIEVIRVWQDEPTEGLGDGNTAPDAVIGDAGGVRVRQERSGLGDGRIYEIEFEATSGPSTCTGSVEVSVPHDQGRNGAAIDSGARYDSTSANSSETTRGG